MFCTHCGKEIPEDTRFCEYCGAATEVPDEPSPGGAEPLETATPVESTGPSEPMTPDESAGSFEPAAPVESAGSFEPITPVENARPFESAAPPENSFPQQSAFDMDAGDRAIAKKPTNYRLIGLIACLAVVVIVAAIVVGLVFGGGGGYRSPEAAAEGFMNAVVKGDGKGLTKAVSVDVGNIYKILSDYSGESEKDIKAYYKQYYGTDDIYAILDDAFTVGLKRLEDTYGAGYKLTVDVSDSEAYTKSELEDFIEDLEDDEFALLFVNPSKVKAVSEVDVKLTIEAKDGTKESDSTAFTCVKIGSKWYVDEAFLTIFHSVLYDYYI